MENSSATLSNAAFDALGVGVVVFDADRVAIAANACASQLLGLDASALVGVSLDDHAGRVLDETGHPIAASENQVARALDDGEATTGTVIGWAHPRGGVSWLRLTSQGYLEGGDRRAVLTIVDVTEARESDSMAMQESLRDAVTGLNTRSVVYDHLAKGLARVRRSGQLVALAHVEIDDFGALRDNHGTAASDTVLEQVAGRLLTVARAGDTVARLTNSRFALVCEPVRHPDDTYRIAQRVLDSIAEPLTVPTSSRATTDVSLTCCVGMSVSGPVSAAISMIEEASLALTEAQAVGPATCTVCGDET